MGWIEAITAVTREAILFAAVGLFVGGIDELIVDLLYLRHRRRRRTLPPLDDLPPPTRRYALFVAAWDEAGVIGRMLATASARLTYADLTIFVGTYPNDPPTAAAVTEIAAQDPRIRLVVGPRAGPTTKADCLNVLWRAMLADETGGRCYDAVLIHDAEDVVHRGELHVIDCALDTHDAVQLPVHPLPRPGAHLVGGTYLDEFSETNSPLATLPLPSAGLRAPTRYDHIEQSQRSIRIAPRCRKRILPSTSFICVSALWGGDRRLCHCASGH